MVEPFRLDGPTLVSFSGGRTSAYMLRRLLEAHDYALPPDVHVVFENTGKEREETLRFVYEVGRRWDVEIHWLEWRPTPKDVGGKVSFRAWLDADPERGVLVCEQGYQQVGYNSASRQGEPFTALMAMKQYAPNAVTRFCSANLKVETARRFAVGQLGWSTWRNLVGLRHDEGHRVLKMLARNDAGDDAWVCAAPLANAKVTKRDVLDFWWGPGRSYETRTRPQGFDLELRSYEGNCDLCFLKSREAKRIIIRENPGLAAWWIEQEAMVRGQFVTEYGVADLARMEAAQGVFDFDAEEGDVECGLVCG